MSPLGWSLRDSDADRALGRWFRFNAPESPTGTRSGAATGHHPGKRKAAAGSRPPLLPAPRQRGRRLQGRFWGLGVFLSSLMSTARANGTVETFALAPGWSWEPSGEKRQPILTRIGDFSLFLLFNPMKISVNILTKQLPWELLLCHEKMSFFKLQMRLQMLSQSRAPHDALGTALPWQNRGSGAGARLRKQSIPCRGEALKPEAPLAAPGPRAGSEPASPGTPRGIASCLPAAPEGQPGLGSAVSQPLRLPLIHFTLSVLIGSALSPAPPSSHALPPAGCCTAGQPGPHAA